MSNGTKVKSWGNGRITIAVEAGKWDTNREQPHVHVYKNGKRTEARLPGNNSGILDYQDEKAANSLYDDNYNDIQETYQDVRDGKYGD